MPLSQRMQFLKVLGGKPATNYEVRARWPAHRRIPEKFGLPDYFSLRKTRLGKTHLLLEIRSKRSLLIAVNSELSSAKSNSTAVSTFVGC